MFTMTRLSPFVRPLLFAAALLFASAARAQLPQPRLQSIFPPGGRAGETVEVQLNGSDLEGVNELWFDHPGLRGFHVKGNTFRVAIATGVPIGQHDVRVASPLGVSNPRTFVVGDLPESVETEPNDEPAQANPITINAVVNGRSDKTPDVDLYAFDGKRGQRLLIDLAGFRIESRMDAMLKLFDASGAEIASAQDARGLDPLLDVTLPSDGRFVVQVRDVVYGGSADHVYRLTVSDGPHIDAIQPVVATSGQETTFTVLGRNIGGEPAPGQTVSDKPLERRQVTITPPPIEDPDPFYPTIGYLPSQNTVRRGFEYRLPGPDGRLSNPLFLSEATDPLIQEHEPNNDNEHAQELTLPCDISGVFGIRDDLDIYRFQANKGDLWYIEATAERLGSPADPSLVIQKVAEDGKTQDLVNGDDQNDPVNNIPFSTATLDTTVRWQVPDDGTYQVVISDLYASQRGDPRMSYRLNIRPARPDFRLVVMPSQPNNQIGGVTVRAGGREQVFAIVQRIDGFDDAVRVEARDLPPGVSCAPVVIGPKEYQAPLVFTADADATPEIAAISVFGQALSEDRKEVLTYETGKSRVRPEPAHEALAGSAVWPPMAGTQQPLARAARGFVLAVRPGAPFLLTARPDHLVIGPDGSVELTVEVTRHEGFTEAVQVQATDLPRNVRGANVTIPKDKTTATLKLNVPKNVTPGNYTILLRGTGPFPFNKDPNAKKKGNVNVNEPSNPIALTVIR